MIQLKNIEKHYGSIKVLHDINLNLEKGRLLVLIGPSGCGKSTLLRIVNRMIEPTSGQVLINGKDALHLDPVILRRSIGYVIQSVGLFPHLTIQQNVEVVPGLLGWDKNRREERAKEMLSLVRLDPQKFSARYPKELSGGQQQRVGIARALASDPEIMLMDEPFSAVDPITRDQLQEEFLRIQSTVHKTIMFVTHDIDEAIRLADDICFMREGTIVQYADPDTFLLHPANDFVALFIGQERELKRIGRYTVHHFMSPAMTSDSKEQIGLKTNARVALSKLFAGENSLAVVDDNGNRVGSLTLQDFSKTP